MMKKLFWSPLFASGVGTIFSWYTVVSDFIRFYTIEGTIFRLDCPTVNPVKTPCFYGAVGFLVVFIWSITLLRMKEEKILKQQRFVVFFLIAGTLFGWYNFMRGYLKFIHTAAGTPVIGCSGQVTTNPFTTPCFFGSVFFLVTLIAAIELYFRLQKKTIQ